MTTVTLTFDRVMTDKKSSSILIFKSKEWLFIQGQMALVKKKMKVQKVLNKTGF